MGQIYMDFGEPVVLEDVPSAEDRVTLSKIALQVGVAANQVTPITLASVGTMILLGCAPRALTRDELAREIARVIFWAQARDIKITSHFELEHEAELKTELQARIARVVARGNVAEDCIASVEVRHGHPVGEILKFAETCDADLVVLGSQGKGRLQTFLLGSVAEQVLHRLRRSALIVPVSPQ
jgi:glycerol-3-phosphate O-acyltransferase